MGAWDSPSMLPTNMMGLESWPCLSLLAAVSLTFLTCKMGTVDPPHRASICSRDIIHTQKMLN